MSRSTRNQPFCWQEKNINRLFRKIFKDNRSLKSKMLLLYATITEIDSDFNGRDIKYYTKTISTYSGLSKDFIPKGIKYLEDLKIIKIIDERKGGKRVGMLISFTTENIDKSIDIGEVLPPKSFTRKPNTSKPSNGKSATLEDSIIKEDSLLEEDSSCIRCASAPSTKKNLENKEPLKPIVSEPLSESKMVNEVMDVFFNNQTILDSKSFYGRKVYRDACKQLINKFGFKETKMLVLQALTVQSEKFAPVISTPLQLRDKIDALKNYLIKETKSKLNTGEINMPIRDDLPEEEKKNREEAHANGRITSMEMNELIKAGISIKGKVVQD